MNPIPIDTAIGVDPSDTDQPSLTIDGIEDSMLRVTQQGLLVCPSGRTVDTGARFWAYGDLGNLRIASYGAIGVIRATVRTTGTELPLLLLEPDQIVAARRTLEVVWSRIAGNVEGRPAA